MAGFFLTLLYAATGFAQQYNFKNYSVENGLPYVQIFAMFQDSKGYLSVSYTHLDVYKRQQYEYVRS